MSVYVPSHVRAARRMSAFILFVIGVSLMVGLYYVKTRAQSARKDVVRLERLIAEEEAALQVLRAEIAFLEGPERLKLYGEQQLGLAPISVENAIALEDIAAEFPLYEFALSEAEQP